MKILIVEDEVLIREGMSDYLMECGYEVFEAGDGQEALDLFHIEAPDLVLLDIQPNQLLVIVLVGGLLLILVSILSSQWLLHKKPKELLVDVE